MSPQKRECHVTSVYRVRTAKLVTHCHSYYLGHKEFSNKSIYILHGFIVLRISKTFEPHHKAFNTGEVDLTNI